MDKMWAPWRHAYVTHLPTEGCIFCEKPKLDDDAVSYIVARNEHCFSMLNIYPYNNGHLMVSPYRHVACITALNDDEMTDIMSVTRSMCALLRKAVSPHGFNIGMNISRTAGAGIDEHIHMHIVPRWNGDTNFMPVTGDIKVISESLDSTYETLKGLEQG